jgi:hypothetical protein
MTPLQQSNLQLKTVGRRRGVVYRVTCRSNGIVYIGKTQAEYPAARWSQHKQQARNGDSDRFHAAMREHGIDAFDFEVIACVISREDLSQLEMDLIQQYDAEVHGYNSDGPKRWEKQRSQMSAASSLLFKAINQVGIERVMQALNDLF